MAAFVCPKCKTETAIFPANTGGASKMAAELRVPFLGCLPLDPRLARSCDEGTNFLIDVPDSPTTVAFNKLLKDVVKACEESRNSTFTLT